MSYFRIFWRLVVFCWLTAGVVLHIYWVRRFRGAGLPESLALRRRWARRLLQATGVRVQVEGRLPEQACLLVANHRSYLDPILILRDGPVFPVSKSELAAWPVIGYGASMAGVLFLQRSDAAQRTQMLQQIAQTIASGYPVLLFPEGTTSGLPGVLPFRKGAFATAVRAGIPVAPVALCYADPADFWVGREGFLSHAWRRFRAPEIAVTVVYGPVLEAGTADELMQSAADWIEARLIPQKQGIV